MKINYKALQALTRQYLRGILSITAVLLIFSIVISKAAFAACTPGTTNGTDTVSCNGSSDTVNGQDGDDTITDTGGNNNISGGNGNDTITTGGGNDKLTGGAGNDNLTGGAGNDTYNFDTTNDQGTDTIDESGGGTDDNLNFTGSSNNVTVDLSVTGSQTVNSNLTLNMTGPQVENVTGGNGDDIITGNTSNNDLNGGSGNDTLNGGAGNDGLTGAAGNDILNGEAGNDTYRFDTDTALGTDTVNENSSGGTDTLTFAGSDNDVSVNLDTTGNQAVNSNLTLNITAPQIENVIGGNGNDTLTGNDANNSLTGGLGSDILTGGLGNDTYRFDTDNNLEADTINETSGGGTDTINFSGSTSNNTIDLSLTGNQTVNSNLTLNMPGPQIENVVGGSGNDTITGNDSANNLNGGNGNDTLNGGNGNDTLNGGNGNDIVNGGDGNDILNDDAGVDTLNGDAGDDTFNINGMNEFGDIISGGAGSNLFKILSGATGTITLVTTSDNDTLDFSSFGAPVTIDLSNQNQQDVGSGLLITLQGWFKNLIGSAFDDNLAGNDLNNSINGRNGNDTAIIGAGDTTTNIENILTATTPAPTTPAPTTPAPTTPAPTTPAPTTPAPTTPAPTTPAPTTPAPTTPAPTTPAPTTPAPTTPAPTTPAPSATTTAPAIGGGDPENPSDTGDKNNGKPVEIGCDSNPYLMSGSAGNRVAYYDLCGYSSITTALTTTTLPGELPANSTFISGISIQLFNGQKPSAVPAGSKMQVIIPLPASYQGTPVGLVWNATQQTWVTVPVEVKGGYAIIDATQGGIYILVLR